MADNVDLNTISPELLGNNIAVETPSVRIPDRHQFVWGVRDMALGNGKLSFNLPGSDAVANAEKKSADVGAGFPILSDRRVTSLWD